MSGYFRRIRAFGPDIKLFLVYNLLANVGFGVFELIFNLYLLRLGFREDYIGEWRALQTISMAAFALFVGFLLNRYGTWRCIVGGFGALILASLVIALAEGRLLLLVLAGVHGAGLAFLFNPLMPFILEWGKPDQRQHIAAVSFSIVSLSIMIGSLIGGFAPSLLTAIIPGIEEGTATAYRWTLVAGSLVASLGLIPLLLMREPRQARGRQATGPAASPETPTDRQRVRLDVGVFVLTGGLMSIGVGMVHPFYNVFLKTLGASDREVGYVFALGGASAAVIGLAAPFVANRLGSLRAVVLLRLLIVPFYLPLIFAPGYALAVIAYVARQISVSMAWPVDSTFIGELLPPRARSGVYGLRSAAWNVGFAAASVVAGRIIVRAGYDWTFVSLIVFTAAAAVLFFAYYSRHPAIRAGLIPSALPKKSRAAAAARVSAGSTPNLTESEPGTTPVS